MKKQRCLTFEEALNELQTTSENDNDSDEEITNESKSVFILNCPHKSASNCPPGSISNCPLVSDSASDGDKLPPEEMLSDIDVFEKESDEDYEICSDEGQESNDESL